MLRPEKWWLNINLVSMVLLPLSLVYCVIATIRRLLYRMGVLRVVRLEAPVIIVGNITVGGSGKTPFVLWMAHMLKEAGLRPGIISRGYRGKASIWPQVVTMDSNPALVGDEPVLLARASGVPVVVGPDRISDGRMLIDDFGCDVIVSDDGLQHYRLARDLEIALRDRKAGYGNGLCLPSGPLREPRSRLGSVDLEVETGCRQHELEGGGLSTALRYVRFVNAHDQDDSRHLDAFGETGVHAVAGIANPERFFASLDELGISYTPHCFADHHAFSAADLVFDDDRPIIMTAKDAVKCARLAGNNVWFLDVALEVSEVLRIRIDEYIKKVQGGS